MRTLGYYLAGVLVAAAMGPAAGPAPGRDDGPDRPVSVARGTAAQNGGAAAGPVHSSTDAAAEAQADPTGDITFSVPSGTFQGEVSVALGSTVSGAEVRYSTDGQPPGASSPVYSGTPLRFTRTTQLRAQAYLNGAPTGAPGTAMYVARAVNTSHDLPVLLLDAYGAGAPGREYLDTAVMQFSPVNGATSLSAAPSLVSRGGFHLRGQSSAMFPKTPYRLELRDNADDDADLPLLGMPADSDWVLRGPYSDKALIRDAFMHGLGQDMGLHAPRFAFAEVYVNTDAQPVAANDYLGVYLIIETIKNSKNRLDLKQLDEDDTTLPKLTGGYIFKFEWMAAEEPTLPCQGADATCWHYLEVVDPDPLQPAQAEWLRQHLQQFHDLLRSPGFADPVTGYSSFIDVDSFVDQLIVNELSRGMDAYLRSAYFHKDRDGKIVAGPLWDFDLTFGVGGYFQNDQIAGWQHQQTRTPSANDWFQRLLQDPAFVDRVRARWQQLRQGVLSNAQLQARIDRLTAPLTAAAQRNFQRWPNLSTRMLGPFITPTSPTWQGQVQFMRDWMFQRAAWLDTTGGWGSGGPTNPPTTPPATTRPPTPPATTPPASGRTCTAAYSVVGQWTGGFQASVRVTAGSEPITGWRVNWTYANGQTVNQSWEATVSTSGATVTATNAAHNGALGTGASTTFGFLGTWNGTNSLPTPTCTAS
ncbi:CotH kinase family protein [Plantactinospora sp. KLBMP9567]|uniref:CotH kinase family protein n=1 Tax=Plantactinospora sp. KLBMP9567 TaxID=3085900 RepID=UPI00298233D0|nr:CotH kinase family protein [Plantactinospora sp. KLBMP9567]MDW5323987.1 CotH kinase family protein [Plantactinospora sp. KLBMP9567]